MTLEEEVEAADSMHKALAILRKADAESELEKEAFKKALFFAKDEVEIQMLCEDAAEKYDSFFAAKHLLVIAFRATEC